MGGFLQLAVGPKPPTRRRYVWGELKNRSEVSVFVEATDREVTRFTAFAHFRRTLKTQSFSLQQHSLPRCADAPPAVEAVARTAGGRRRGKKLLRKASWEM